MKQRKKMPYLALFIDDWLASAKVRKCSELTRGVYIDLLCILHKEPRRGSYALHDQELKPNTTRSKTQLALAKTSERLRLPYFAEFLVKRTGSAKTVIVKALQELLHRGIIVVEDDALIQPRMYHDSGYHLKSDAEAQDDQNNEAEGQIRTAIVSTGDDAETTTKKEDIKEIEKETGKSDEKTRARASRERAHIHNGSGSGNNNNINDNNNKDINSAKSKKTTAKEKTEKNTPGTTATAANRKKVVAKAQKPTVADNPPTIEKIAAYMEKRAQQGQPFEYITAEQFYNICEADGWMRHGKALYSWEAYLRNCEAYRREHGDKKVSKRIVSGGGPTGRTNVTASTSKNHKEDEW